MVLLGMKIEKGTKLGRVSCEWPSKVFIGNNCVIQDKVDFRIGNPFNEANIIEIGNHTFIGRCCELNSGSSIKIGSNCLIASNTTIVDLGHEVVSSDKLINSTCTSSPIVIHDDVWIGTRSVILQGTVIGKGSIIGAGSVVTKSVPEYQIWAGTPARFIRNRI